MADQGRKCFVTVGATAGFRLLLDEITEPKFLQVLAGLGYDELDVQCGPDNEWFGEKVRSMQDQLGIKITHFQLTREMKDHMLQCRGEEGIRRAGCVISHAGSGTVLEAMRYGVPLVVVPNPTLMNNHQAELAEECEKQRWAIYGRLGQLHVALNASEQHIIEGRLHELPPYSPPPFRVPEPERVKILDWMVLTCYPEESSHHLHMQDLDRADAEYVRDPAHMENAPTNLRAEHKADRLHVD